MYWPTVVQCSPCFVKPHASGTRQAVCLLPSCTHEVHFCLSNYPPDFSPTCHFPHQYGGLRCGVTARQCVWRVRPSIGSCLQLYSPEHSCPVATRGLPCISGLSVTILDYYKIKIKEQDSPCNPCPQKYCQHSYLTHKSSILFLNACKPCKIYTSK